MDNILYIFCCIFFCGLECTGHSFAYVAPFVFLRDVWIRTQRSSTPYRTFRLFKNFKFLHFSFYLGDNFGPPGSGSGTLVAGFGFYCTGLLSHKDSPTCQLPSAGRKHSTMTIWGITSRQKGGGGGGSFSLTTISIKSLWLLHVRIPIKNRYSFLTYRTCRKANI